VSLPVRHARRAQRRPPVRRASSRVSAGRVAAGFVAAALVAMLYGVTASPAFALDRLEISGTRFTVRAAVERIVGIGGADAPNVFELDRTRIREEILRLPAVLDAEVRVILPDRVTIHVTERQPVLAWQVGRRRFLVAVDGVILAEGAVGVASDGTADGRPLPTFIDERSGRPTLRPGGSLDVADLDVARRLGAVTPKLAGSRAKAFEYRVTDSEGFVVTPGPKSWRAVFGIYTATLRPAELVPAQVQCLGALIATRGEAKLQVAYLFPDGDRCGTFAARGAAGVSRALPVSGSSSTPGSSPAPGGTPAAVPTARPAPSTEAVRATDALPDVVLSPGGGVP
jgi:hypothetical protein